MRPLEGGERGKPGATMANTVQRPLLLPTSDDVYTDGTRAAGGGGGAYEKIKGGIRNPVVVVVVQKEAF
jgi:hypothetical protein